MKKFNKVLAVILSLLMLLTAVPLNAFAANTSGSGAAGGAVTPGNQQMTVTLQTPNPTGTGANGTLTLRIDIPELVAALRTEGSMTDALLQVLRNMVDRSNADMITLDELMQMIPTSQILRLLLGANNENVPALVEQFGGIDALINLLGEGNGIDGVFTLVTDVVGLADLILTLPNVTELVNIDAIFNLGIDLKLDEAYDNLDRDVLEAKLVAAGLDLDKVLTFVEGNSKAEKLETLETLVNYKALLNALLANTSLTLEQIVDLAKLKGDETVKAAIVNILKNNYSDILTDAGKDELEAIISNGIAGDVSVSTLVAGTHYNKAAVIALIKSFATNNDMTTVVDMSILANDATMSAAISEIIKEEAEAAIAGGKNSGDLLDTAGQQAWLMGEPIAWANLKSDFQKTVLESSKMEAYLPRLLNAATLAKATDAVKADTVAYFNGTLAAPTYLIDTYANGLVNSVITTLNENSISDGNIKKDVLLSKLETAVPDFDPFNYLNSDFDLFAQAGVMNYIFANLNWTNLGDGDKVDYAVLFDLVLGADEEISVLFTDIEKYKAYILALENELIAKLNENPHLISDIVKTENLIANIPSEKYTDLVGCMDMQAAFARLIPHAKELLVKLTKTQIADVAAAMLGSLMRNIKLISVDGYEIAKTVATGDTAGLLGVNYGELAKMLAAMIPSLEELAETDGKILSFNFYAEYKYVNDTDADPIRKKDINVEVVLEGDLTLLRQAAAKLAEVIDITREGNVIKVELNVPYVITEAYAKLLNSEEGAELKKAILALADKNGGELVEVFENLTLDEILGLLAKVDPEALYSKVMNLAIVETALEKVMQKLGVSYELSDLQDLNVVLDKIAAGLPTMQAVSDAIKARFNVDVMAVLQTVATTADSNATVQAMLDKLCAAPKIGPYITRFIDGRTAAEILDTYKDMEPVAAVSAFLEARIGENLQELLATYDANELYEAALARAAEYESYYNRIKDVILNVLDPDAAPNGSVAQILKSIIPESLLRKLLASALTDAYVGNGSFYAKLDSATVDLAVVSNKIKELVASKLTSNPTVLGLLDQFLPTGSFTFGAEFTVNFKEISEVTYVDAAGNQLLTTYLANGVNPSVAITAPTIEGSNFLYWADEQGNEVTAVNGDTTLYAVYETTYWVTLAYRRAPDNAPVLVPVLEGETLDAEWLEKILTEADLGLPENEQYLLQWYMADGTPVTNINTITGTPVTADITYYYDYVLVSRTFKISFVYGKDETKVFTYNQVVNVNETINVTIPAELVELINVNDTYAILDTLGLTAGVKYGIKWYNADGTETDAATIAATVVNADITYKFVYEAYPTYKVTFVNTYADNAVLKEYTVYEGDKLPADFVLPTIPTAEDVVGVNGDYTLVWKKNGTAIDPATIKDVVVDAVIEYTFAYELVAGTEIFEPTADLEKVEKNEDNEWTVTMTGDDFTLTVKNPDDLASMEQLTVVGDKTSMVIDNTTLKQIAEASAAAIAAGKDGKVTLTSSGYVANTDVELENDHYIYTPEKLYNFELKIGNEALNANFAGEFKVTVPYEGGIAAPNEQEKTVIYIVNGDKVDFLDTDKITVNADGTVTFNAPHFSDYVIVNEYKVAVEFTGPMTGSLDLEGKWIPEGADIKSVRPVFAGNTYGKYVESLHYYTTDPTATTDIGYLGSKLENMPGAAITIVVQSAVVPFGTYYVVNGTVYTDATAAAAAVTLPVGYKSFTWVGGESMSGEVYLMPSFKPTTYKLTFADDATTPTEFEFTIENYKSVFNIPEVPGKDGMLASWSMKLGEADAVLFESNPVELIKKLAAANLTELTVEAAYTPKTYQVFVQGETVDAAFGTTVELTITVRPGYHIESITLVNTVDANAPIEMNGTKFTMPAANVRVIVVEKPNTINFAVAEMTDAASRQDLTALFDNYATYSIVVPKNSVLAKAPAIGKLVSLTVNADGSKTLTYAFLVTEEIVDNTVINYQLQVKVPAKVFLASGKVTTETEPASAIKNLTFTGFATPDAFKFETAEYQLAQYQAPEGGNGLLWLWILIAVLVLIGLIALFYSLYIRGKLKTNFMLRFITWIVSIFFNICLGVSAIVLWITQGTTKKEEIDFNEFGMTNPAPETDEETEAEAEATEEVTEEAEVAEEAAEDAVEDAAEETPAEEATETETATEEAPAAEAEDAVELETEEELPTEDETKKGE